jgi:hypothetical protein
MLRTIKSCVNKLLVVELILHGAHHGIVDSTQNVLRILAFSVYGVIFVKKFMFFMRIYRGDYGAWNPYLASAQRLHPTCVRTIMFS